MSDTSRRSAIKILLSLPVVGGMLRETVFASESTPYGARIQDGNVLSVLKFINTAERQHFQKFDEYVHVKDFLQSKPVVDYINSDWAEKWGIGRSLWSNLQLDKTEIVPGWKMEFNLLERRRGYTVTLTSANGRKAVGAYTTDQAGVIFEGRANYSNLPVTSSYALSARNLVVGARPIGSDTRANAFFKTVALGSPLDLCCFGCCDCDFCCGPGSGGQECPRNCGCEDCTWCIS